MIKRKLKKSVIAGALAVVMTVMLAVGAVPTSVRAESGAAEKR